MGIKKVSLCAAISYFLFLFVVANFAHASTMSMNPSPFYLPGNAIDVGSQLITANAVISGGLGAPYDGNWIITPPSSSGAAMLGLPLTQLPPSNEISLTINAISSNTMQFGFNGILYNVESTGSNTIYGSWSIEAYAQDSSAANSISSNRTLMVYSPLSVSISATKSNITQGQSSTLTGIASGGTGASNYSFQWYESFGNGTYSAVTSATSNTFVFSTNRSTKTGNYSFKLQLTDLGTANHYSTNSTALTIRLNQPNIVITHVGVLQNVSYYGFPPIAYLNSTGSEALTQTTYSSMYELSGYRLKNTATNTISNVIVPYDYVRCFSSLGGGYILTCNEFPMNDTPPGTYEISLYVYNFSNSSKSFFTNYSAPFTVKIGTSGMVINGPSTTVYNGTGTRVYYTLLDNMMQLNGTAKLNGNVIQAIKARPTPKSFSVFDNLFSVSVNPEYPNLIYAVNSGSLYMLNASSMSIVRSIPATSYSYFVGGNTGNYEYIGTESSSIDVLNPENLSVVGVINLTGSFMGGYAINGTIYAIVQNSTSNGVEIINSSAYKTIGYVPVPDSMSSGNYPYPTYVSKHDMLAFVGLWDTYMHIINFYPSNDTLKVLGSPPSDYFFITYYSNVTDQLYFINSMSGNYNIGMIAVNQTNSKESKYFQNMFIEEFDGINQPDFSFISLPSSEVIYSSGQSGLTAFDVLNKNSYVLSSSCGEGTGHTFLALAPKNTRVLNSISLCNITAGSTLLKAAGTYNLTLSTPGDQNYTSNTTSETFTIEKATPKITFPRFPKNFTYNGSTAIIEANISTYGNQLGANVFANNALLGSFYSSNDFAVGAAAGDYVVTADTLGNSNYTLNRVSRNFAILKAVPKFAFTLSDQNAHITLNKSGMIETAKVFSNEPFNITVNITTYKNQLPGWIYVDNKLNSTINSSKTIHFTAGSLSIGLHNITLDSAGNNNYTSLDPTFIINVTQAPSHSTSSAQVSQDITALNNMTVYVLKGIKNVADFIGYNTTMEFTTNYSRWVQISISTSSLLKKEYPRCLAPFEEYISTTLNNTAIAVSLPYNSSMSGKIPTICENDTWVPMRNYSINSQTHRINITIYTDPLIGLVNESDVITTTVATTTVPPKTSTVSTTVTTVSTTIPASTTIASKIVTTPIAPSKTQHSRNILYSAIVLLAIIAFILYRLRRKQMYQRNGGASKG